MVSETGFLVCGASTIFFIIVSDALALSCSKDLQKTYETSDAIVVGEVLSYNEIQSEKKPIYKGAESTVKIIESIKGQLKEGDEVKIDLMSFYGPPMLEKNNNYVLFLKKNSDDNSYQLPVCSIYYEYTQNMKEYSDLLKYKNSLGVNNDH